MRLLFLALLVLQDADVVAYKPDLPKPDDFDAFWRRQIEGLEKADYELTKLKESTDQLDLYELSYPSVDGRTKVLGWFSAPAGAKAMPAVMSIPAFGGTRGRGAPRPSGACGLVVGYRGDGDEPWPGDWITRGLDRIETSVFRIHYLNLVRAVRFLQARPEVDAKRIVLQGGSMGGALAVVVAGLLKKEILGIVATAPGMDYYFNKDGTPVESTFKQMEKFVADRPKEKARILKVLGYYAPIHFAPEVAASVLIACGGKDRLCTPKMVYAVYNHLGTASKEIKYYADAGHGGFKDDWPEVSRAWMAKRMQ